MVIKFFLDPNIIRAKAIERGFEIVCDERNIQSFDDKQTLFRVDYFIAMRTCEN